MIVAEKLTKQYGKQFALDSIDAVIGNNMITGLIGPNGAGKSTFMKLICGYIPATSGNIRVNDINVGPSNTKIRKMIGYLPESNPLYFDMYVKEYLNYVAAIYGIKNIKESIDKVVEMTGLHKEKHKKIGLLSKGYKQRVGLAQAIIHDPQILILDEPTSGLDPNQIIEIRELISNLGKNKVVLLATHILQEVEAICSEVIVVNNGRIVKHGKTKNIQQDQSTSLVVEFDKNPAESELLALPMVDNAKNVKGRVWIITSKNNTDIRSEIFKFAVERGLIILSSQIKSNKLEDIYRDLIQ